MATKTRSRKPAAQAVFSSALEAGYKTAADAIDLGDAPFEDVTPEVIVIDQAAVEEALGAWFEANELKKAADRDVRKHKKVFQGLPGRVYGKWRLTWKPSAREVPDMDAIIADYARHGLGKVPMKPCAPSADVTPA